jgi:hypothetical protein
MAKMVVGYGVVMKLQILLQDKVEAPQCKARRSGGAAVLILNF